MVIKEKLMLSRDYSFINKNCYSCRQFNHTVKECPKLHFVPNIEKIIKEYTYPIFNERSSFLRRKKKASNALLFRLDCKKAQKKFSLMIVKKSIKVHDSESSFDSKEEKLIQITEEDEFEETKEDSPKKREDFLLHPYKTDATSKDEGSESPRTSSLLGSDPKVINSQKTMAEHQSLKSIAQKKNSSDNVKQVIENSSELEIDRVFSYQIYFPRFNIENIIKGYNKTLNLEREINKKYMVRYRNFKNYTFFQNTILEKFWGEAKISKKKRKLSRKTPVHSAKKENLKARKSFFFKRQPSQSCSPLTKKSFFGTNNTKTDITNFTELIHTLITQKHDPRKSQK